MLTINLMLRQDIRCNQGLLMLHGLLPNGEASLRREAVYRYFSAWFNRE